MLLLQTAYHSHPPDLSPVSMHLFPAEIPAASEVFPPCPLAHDQAGIYKSVMSLTYSAYTITQAPDNRLLF